MKCWKSENANVKKTKSSKWISLTYAQKQCRNVYKQKSVNENQAKELLIHTYYRNKKQNVKNKSMELKFDQV